MQNEQADEDDFHLTMMEWKAWKRRTNQGCLPTHFRDTLPELAVALLSAQETVSSADAVSTTSTPFLVTSEVRWAFKTAHNGFGLFRQYYGTQLPTHDPEAHLSSKDLSTVNGVHSSSALSAAGEMTLGTETTSFDYHPFPNASSFHLGRWFWNGGPLLSKKHFRDLLKIIGDINFVLEDLKMVNWSAINQELGAEEVGDWLDDNAGWKRTPVSIAVPYQRCRGVPASPVAGPRTFIVEDFYHCDILSVLKEKLSKESHNMSFHYEPHKLYWQPKTTSKSIGVYGELYTSLEFNRAHHDLQNSPPEPGCNHPQVIAAIMLSSDSTHLTSFGDVKLTPLYMFFGNDSKARCCKSSCNLCEHIAYFQTVCICAFCVQCYLNTHGCLQWLLSYRRVSRNSPQHRMAASHPQRHSSCIATTSLYMHS